MPRARTRRLPRSLLIARRNPQNHSPCAASRPKRACRPPGLVQEPGCGPGGVLDRQRAGAGRLAVIFGRSCRQRSPDCPDAPHSQRVLWLASLWSGRTGNRWAQSRATVARNPASLRRPSRWRTTALVSSSASLRAGTRPGRADPPLPISCRQQRHLVAVRAPRRVISPGGQPHVHDTIGTPVRSGRHRAVLPALIDRLGPARRGCAGKPTGRRYRSAAAWWARARPGIISGCPQTVPVSPRCPTTRCPARRRQTPLQMLVKQRSRNPRSRSRHGPNRWSRRRCHRQCRRQCPAAGTPAAATAIAAAGTGTGAGASAAPGAAAGGVAGSARRVGCYLIPKRAGRPGTRSAPTSAMHSRCSIMPPRRRADPARWRLTGEVQADGRRIARPAPGTTPRGRGAGAAGANTRLGAPRRTGGPPTPVVGGPPGFTRCRTATNGAARLSR